MDRGRNCKELRRHDLRLAGVQCAPEGRRHWRAVDARHVPRLEDDRADAAFYSEVPRHAEWGVRVGLEEGVGVDEHGPPSLGLQRDLDGLPLLHRLGHRCQARFDGLRDRAAAQLLLPLGEACKTASQDLA
eukprot:3921125-Lingulodinium_polyedra.AAC.1